jgi:competence protein ComFB
LSAQKKIFDLDKRKQNKSVVQRFITDDAPEENQETAQEQQAAPVSDLIKERANPAYAVPAEAAPGEYNIAAQLEKLENRLEKFESKVGGLDKLDKLNKLDELDKISNLDKLDKLDRLDELPNLEQGSPKYILFNAMEEAVKEEVRATMANVNICRCDKCYIDICALVLNNMIPQYATSQEGILMKKASTLLSMETLTKLSGEIFSAIDKVKNKPDH